MRFASLLIAALCLLWLVSSLAAAPIYTLGDASVGVATCYQEDRVGCAAMRAKCPLLRAAAAPLRVVPIILEKIQNIPQEEAVARREHRRAYRRVQCRLLGRWR